MKTFTEPLSEPCQCHPLACSEIVQPERDLKAEMAEMAVLLDSAIDLLCRFSNRTLPDVRDSKFIADCRNVIREANKA